MATYNAKELFDDSAKTGGTNIPYGIHTAVSVASVSKKVTPNGNKFVEILFEKDGGKLSKTLWEPKGSYPLDEETQEQAIARESRENLRHIAKLLGIFLTEEKLKEIPNLDYEGFIDRAILTLTPLLSTKKVNLKVIYESNGIYTELGKYPDYVELYQEGVEPTLAFSKYELEKRSTKRAAPTKKVNPLEDLLGDDVV